MVETDALKTINFLKDFSQETLEGIGAIAEKNTFPEGDVLIRQDEENSLIYMVLSGSILLNCQTLSGTTETLNVVVPGQIVGVSALIGESVAGFTAVCAEECSVITLPADKLFELFKQDYRLAYRIMHSLIHNNLRRRLITHTQQFLKLLRHSAMV